MNHPPNVLEEIPKSISKRLASVASSKELFVAVAPEYQKALDESGHNHKLKFTAHKTHKKRKPRSRNIMWFNPPFNMLVTTNVSAAFL